MNIGSLLCSGIEAELWGIFNFSGVPSLLYYSYFPIIFVIVLLSLFVYLKNKQSALIKSFLLFSLILVSWIILNLFLWVLIDVPVSVFLWRMTGFLDVLVYITAFNFFFNFAGIEKTLKMYLFFLLGLIPAIVFTSTRFSVSFFDVLNCNAIFYPLWNYFFYGYGIFTTLTILFIGIKKFFLTDILLEKSKRIQTLILTFGLVSFLSIFIITNSLGDYTSVFEINLFGPIGMVVLLGIISYMIVKYKAFNIKLLGAQALVVSLVVLIGSQFFFIQNDINKILTGATLVVAGGLGLTIIRSVKLIDRQKDELEKASQEKSEFMSFAAHQIRTPVTVMRGYASNILEGDYGEVSKDVKTQLQKMLISANDLIYLIADYLDKAKMELGQLKYAMNPFDLKALVSKTVSDFKTHSEHNNLPINFSVAAGDYTIVGDENKIKQIVGNLIDNSLKYNVEGGHVDVSLERDEEKKLVRIIVADNGKGIAPETMPYLFLKFGRGSNAEKSSINGTGLGLYLAKQMIDAHHGSIHAESSGLGTGAKFIVELPVAAISTPTPTPVVSAESPVSISTEQKV